MSADDGPGTREVARRLFAAEYDDATLSYSESDEERAPNYVVTPTGARVNRLFVVGVLTETESVNEDMLRARIVDPTGAFVAYAGQYQPDALAFFERSTPPAFVALTGKARTFQPEDSEQVFTSVRPETVNQVDADTRDRWSISAAKATLRRLSLFDAALSSGLRGDDLERHLHDHDVEDALAAGIPRAIDHYGTTTGYLDAVRQVALDALAVVAGEREEVRELSLAPDEGGPAALGQIPADLRADDAIATPEESMDGAASSTAAGDAASDEGAVGDVPDDETVAEPSAQEDSGTAAEATTDTVESADATEHDESVEPADDTAATSESDVATAEATSEADVQTDAAAADSDDLGSFDESLSAGTDESAGATTDESEEATTDESAGAPPDESDAEATAEGESVPDVAEDDLYEFDEEEREAVREEHGLSFESGAEVDSPGEAGIETPESGDATQGTSGTDDVDAEDTASVEASSDQEGGDEEAVSDEESTDDEAEAAEVDSADDELEGELTDVVVDVMADLDEGDGADRQQVVAAVVQRRGTDPGDVEDAIQEALMDGKCYEPGEDRLKAI